MVSSGSTGYDRKVWESLTHFYAVDAWLPRNYVFVNKESWDDLDDATRNVINGCGSIAEYAGYWRSVQYTEFTLAELAANGMVVERAGDGLQAELEQIGETMTSEWLENAGDTGTRIVDAFKASR